MTQTQRRTDTQLKNAIVEELDWAPNVSSARIGVAVDKGAVTLSGEVDTYPERHYAEKAALRVGGVTAVAEEITVRNSTKRPTDSDIAREAGEALDRAVDVPDGAVKAVVHEGRVTLSGPVTWQFQREAAGRSVRYLKGVASVRNDVIIKPIASSYGIHTAISAALTRSAQLESQHITVTAHDSTATLEGTVRSWHDRQQAGIAAWSAPGVTQVKNHLRVAD
jgi:osmotically-inducible protein OsmY